MKVHIIKWEDSSSDEEMAWKRLSSIENEPNMICISVGVIIKEDENNLVVIPHWSDTESSDGCGCGVMNIPKSAIINMTSVKVNI